MNSAHYALGIVALLIGLQAKACVGQWQLGFRPFVQAPGRVALSWDMFSVAIDRCEMRWEPASNVQGGKPATELRGVSAPIEWDTVYGRRQEYLSAATYACRQLKGPAGERPQQINVHCFVGHGEETRDDVSCTTP